MLQCTRHRFRKSEETTIYIKERILKYDLITIRKTNS